jgi:hypothetical protein
MSVMKIRTLLLTLFCGICFSISAQIDSFQGNVIDYLNNNGTEEQYSEAYDGIFVVLKKQFINPIVPEELWIELKQGKKISIQELIAFLSFAYRKHFTEAEIVKMAAFYKSDAGQKRVHHAPDISEEDQGKINSFFSSELCKKIDAKQEALSADIDKISRSWRRDLFGATMVILVKKGYLAR